MPRKRGRKTEVRVFLPEPTLAVIDEMVRAGNFTSRSEAIRSLLDAHLRDCLGLLKLGKKEGVVRDGRD